MFSSGWLFGDSYVYIYTRNALTPLLNSYFFQSVKLNISYEDHLLSTFFLPTNWKSNISGNLKNDCVFLPLLLQVKIFLEPLILLCVITSHLWIKSTFFSLSHSKSISIYRANIYLTK